MDRITNCPPGTGNLLGTREMRGIVDRHDRHGPTRERHRGVRGFGRPRGGARTARIPHQRRCRRQGFEIQFHVARIRPGGLGILAKIGLAHTGSKVDISRIKELGETSPEDLENNPVSDDSDDLRVRRDISHQRQDMVIEEGSSTGLHRRHGLPLRVRRFASTQNIRSPRIRRRSARLPSRTFQRAKRLLFQKRSLERNQETPAQLLPTDPLGCIRRAIQVRREHMGKPHPVVPVVSR